MTTSAVVRLRPEGVSRLSSRRQLVVGENISAGSHFGEMTIARVVMTNVSASAVAPAELARRRARWYREQMSSATHYAGAGGSELPIDHVGKPIDAVVLTAIGLSPEASVFVTVHICFARAEMA